MSIKSYDDYFKDSLKVYGTNKVICLILAFSIWCGTGDSYPSGAPPTACQSLTPKHRYYEPQEGSSPYEVSATKNGNKVTVKISSPYGEEFQGFVMQARSAKNKGRIINGVFSTSPGISKTIDCSNGEKNTITQVNKTSKREIVTAWTPGQGINEEVIFRATVAQNFEYFWTEIDSSPVKITASSQKQSQKSRSRNIYNDCFVNKGCFGYPPNCVTRSNCDVLLSYVDNIDGVSFTLHGNLGFNTYMAMGLSFDRLMGGDSVTECFIENGGVIVQHSWNEGKKNNPLTRVPEGLYEYRINNGEVRCSWTRPYITTTAGEYFNLQNTTYYVLLAKGPVFDGRIGRHDNRLASQEKVNFTAYESIMSAGAHDAIKIHGAFMVTGWVAFVSFAIIIARHFKNAWEDKMPFGVKVWFAVHRGFMLIALLFIGIAFVTIFIYRKGWNYEIDNTHAVLGCIATTLGFIQPFMAICRPSPDHPKRPIFNWLHWAVGNIAHLLAFITIFYAASLDASGLDDSLYWVMGVFVIVYYGFHIVFHLHSYSLERKKNNEVKLQEIGSSRPINGQSDHTKTLPANVFKVLLLGIYGIFLTVIMITLYSLIGRA